ncbi:hypothetical protein E2C01_040080 [Portunus trituberculatus]|uniref:Reverse transcriptase domain-containing protein n=1 Tax=Portunus trituberculatus TaxID=210409 RepID=A0A5B7FGF5_PORTR|nr:hypothetical protein [Portunus trituberculatus]
MGPLCFLILINDTLTNTPHHWKYVDDCTVLPLASILVARWPGIAKSANLLGVTVDNQLTCKQHVTTTVRSAAYKLYMLRTLKSLCTLADKLKGEYLTFILPRIMYSSPAWSSSLTSTQQQQLEDVQKRTCRIILDPAYTNYDHALTTLSLPRLSIKHQEALVKLGRGLLRQFTPSPSPLP